MAPLTARIRVALQAGMATQLADLQALLLESGSERCYRRERITHLLTRYLTLTSPLPMSSATTHRFKAAFADTAVALHTPETRTVTARNLTDADVLPLQQAGYAHLLEELPAQATATDLHKLTKAELADKHQQLLGQPAPADATKADLIAAIESK